MTRLCRAVLVGAAQQENLALGYLASAAERAGHQIHCVGYGSRADIPRVVGEVARLSPDLVGLSIAFQHALGEYLALAEALRAGGYAGHVTAGGQVPTFSHRELLEENPALDTAVRHDGERTFVELLEKLGRDDHPAGIPGLVWRERDRVVIGPPRAPVRQLDELPFPRRPCPAQRIGEVAIASILTSRGCFGSCSYCAVHAFAAEGGPRVRLRSPERVADEVAMLYERGVRALLVEDDLFFLPDERRALARLGELRAAFAARGVGPLAIWAKARPESVTQRVASAARELGIVHLFLGIESATPERLSYLGRTHSPRDSEQALALCRAHDIRPSFNLMLFDPDATLEEIAQSIAFGRSEVGTPFGLGRTEVFPGTPLFARLRNEGRLVGDYRGYGYEMRDARAELMYRILRVALRDRAFSRQSLLGRLTTLDIVLRFQRYLGIDPARFAERAQALLGQAQEDTLAALDEALEFSAQTSPEDHARVHRFALDLGLAAGRADARIEAALDTLWSEIAPASPRYPHAPAKSVT
jgi:anaerobic magnesium-protoporphyrin IX monomethyl ester cyclase